MIFKATAGGCISTMRREVVTGGGAAATAAARMALKLWRLDDPPPCYGKEPYPSALLVDATGFEKFLVVVAEFE